MSYSRIIGYIYSWFNGEYDIFNPQSSNAVLKRFCFELKKKRNWKVINEFIFLDKNKKVLYVQ